MDVTRDVIRDLWALSAAGEASADSRRLVDAFLAQDVELAHSLTATAGPLAAPQATLPADHEAQTLLRMKRRLQRRSPLRLVALGLTGLTVARLVEQTSFTSSPREVIALSVASVVAWIAHAWHSRYLQQRAVFGK